MATKSGAAPFRSSNGLSTRHMSNSDEVQLQIDPMHGDLDNEITAQEIHSEAKFQSDFMDQLQSTLARAQSSVKSNMRRLNSSIVHSGSNHVLHVVVFALFCLFLVYFWSKFSRH